MIYKNIDEFDRMLRRNIYISKIKDVNFFIQFINNVYKSITGKNSISEFFYKFDRILNIKLKKLEHNIFQFEIFLRNVKSNFQLYVEDLYSLLYLFFIEIEILNMDVVRNQNSFCVKLDIKFNINKEHNILIRDVLLRIKQLKKRKPRK